MVALLLPGCAGVPVVAETPAKNRAPELQNAELYVGHGFGGVAGFYMLDGEVTGGFVLPYAVNRSDAERQRIPPNMRKMLSGALAWPIGRVTRTGDHEYIVSTVAGKFANPAVLQLKLAEVDRHALFYSMHSGSEGRAVVYSGTAINVGALAGRLVPASPKEVDGSR